MTFKLNGHEVTICQLDESIGFDCDSPDGPRVWLERTESNDGWRVAIHEIEEHGGSATVILPDKGAMEVVDNSNSES